MMNTLFHRRPQRGVPGFVVPGLIAGAAIFMTACASTPPPTEQVAVSTAAVANAVTAGAPELAPVEMKTARDKLDRANAAMATKDYNLALSLAQEAQVDAGVAQAKAQSTKSRKAAQAVQEDNRALQEELDRKTK